MQIFNSILILVPNIWGVTTYFWDVYKTYCKKSQPKEYWEVYCKTADMNMLENEEHSRHRITDGDPDEDDQDQHRTDQTPMSPIPVQRADLPGPIWSNF